MKKLNHILCPIDFSPNSYQAIPQASFLAQMFQADLTLVHVITHESMEALGGMPGIAWDTQEQMDNAGSLVREKLRSVKKEHVPYAITCKSALRYGEPVEGIIEEAYERETELIFMSAIGNGKTGASEVSIRVVQEAGCPVLIYHEKNANKGFRRVYIPSRHGESLETASQFIEDYLSIMSPAVVVAPVGGSHLAPEAVRERFAGSSFTQLHIHPLASSDGSAVNQHAVEHHCDLIILRADADSQMLEELIRSATLPVLVLRG